MAAGGAALAGGGNLIENALGVSAFGLLFPFGGFALVIGLLIADGCVLTTAPPWR